MSWPIGDYFLGANQNGKTTSRPIHTYKAKCVVDRINFFGSQVLIGAFKTIKEYEWIKKDKPRPVK